MSSVKRPDLAQRNKERSTHRLSHQPTYTTWRSMKSRCTNPNNASYHRYGGRGISICDYWLNDFRNFLNDMGIKPKDSNIDRVDNDGNYCKENCRWVTPIINQRNKSTNRIIKYNGEEKTVSEWAELIGITRQGLRYRLEVGYSLDDCMNKKNFYGKLIKEKSE